MSTYVLATVTRWVSDKPIPGLVEVVLVDGASHAWTFVDKTVMFGPKDNILLATSSYPAEVHLACTVVRRTAEAVTVSTALPYGLETTDGKSTFVVLPSQIVKSPG